MKTFTTKGGFPVLAGFLRSMTPFFHRVIREQGRLQRFLVAAAVSVGLWSSLYPVPVQAAPKGGVELSHAEAVSYFLLNCAYFGKWEGDRDPQVLKVIRIGVLGRDPFGDTLTEVAEKARSAWFAYGRIVIERSDDPERLRNCHVVYVSTSERDRLAAILADFKTVPVLLVSEIPNFAERGGIIEVRIREERLQYDINLDQLAGRGFSLSSKMKKRASSFISTGRRVPNTLSEGASQ